jgi:hypothetical protein
MRMVSFHGQALRAIEHARSASAEAQGAQGVKYEVGSGESAIGSVAPLDNCCKAGG